MDRTILGIPKVLYHGTTSNNIESLISRIDLSRCTNIADFGRGFYTTPDFETALRWSDKRAKQFNKFRDSGFVQGVVFTIDVDQNLFSCHGKIFQSSAYQWVKFIHKNRSQKIRFNHEYDFVFGEIADSNIEKLISDKDNGTISYGEMLSSIKFRYRTDYQLSFHTERAIQCIKLRSEVKYYEEFKEKVNLSRV